MADPIFEMKSKQTKTNFYKKIIIIEGAVRRKIIKKIFFEIFYFILFYF